MTTPERWTLWLLSVALLALLLACTGCVGTQTRTWSDWQREIESGRYECRRHQVWYRGRWVPVLDPKWTPEVTLPTKGPRT